MNPARTVNSIFAAALASALCWQASAAAAPVDAFGMRATFEPRHFVLEMRLPILCLRLVGEIADPPPAIPGFVIASAYLFACDDCPGASGARSWS